MDFLEWLDHLETPDLLVLLEHQVSRVLQASRVLSEPQDLQEGLV